MEAVKITRPIYIGNIGPQIAAYAKKINFPNITYETLYQKLCEMSQFGKDIAELLADKFVEFAKRNRCEFMKCQALNKKVAGLFKKYASERDIEVEEKSEITLFARRS